MQEWLSSNGLTATTDSPAGDWLMVTVPVEKANELLGADYQTYYNPDTDLETVRTLSYSIPAELQGHIDVVHPTTRYV